MCQQFIKFRPKAILESFKDFLFIGSLKCDLFTKIENNIDKKLYQRIISKKTKSVVLCGNLKQILDKINLF